MVSLRTTVDILVASKIKPEICFRFPHGKKKLDVKDIKPGETN